MSANIAGKDTGNEELKAAFSELATAMKGKIDQIIAALPVP